MNVKRWKGALVSLDHETRLSLIFKLEFEVKMAYFGRLNVLQSATETQNSKLCSNQGIKDEWRSGPVSWNSDVREALERHEITFWQAIHEIIKSWTFPTHTHTFYIFYVFSKFFFTEKGLFAEISVDKCVDDHSGVDKLRNVLFVKKHTYDINISKIRFFLA